MSIVQGHRAIALAGRRADPSGSAAPLFPTHRLEAIADALAAIIEDAGAEAYVSSAASGADLLGLEAAARVSVRAGRRIERHVILPFAARLFRKRSVTDRPGPWDEWFDRTLRDPRLHLVELTERGDSESAYERANERIIAEARARADERRPLALVLWTGRPRARSDSTASFYQLASRAGFRILNLDPSRIEEWPQDR